MPGWRADTRRPAASRSDLERSAAGRTRGSRGPSSSGSRRTTGRPRRRAPTSSPSPRRSPRGQVLALGTGHPAARRAGCLLMLSYQAGCLGAPPIDATSAYSPSCSTRISGTYQSLPDLAPRMVTRTTSRSWILAASVVPASRIFSVCLRTQSTGLISYVPSSGMSSATPRRERAFRANPATDPVLQRRCALGTIAAVTGSGTYIEVARKLMDENARAIRDVYEKVLADPRTTERQRHTGDGADPPARRGVVDRSSRRLQAAGVPLGAEPERGRRRRHRCQVGPGPDAARRVVRVAGPAPDLGRPAARARVVRPRDRSRPAHRRIRVGDPRPSGRRIDRWSNASRKTTPWREPCHRKGRRSWHQGAALGSRDGWVIRGAS